MLRELSQNRPDKENRRWFSDEDMDLIVWAAGSLVRGFQLCYDKRGSERALTWFAEQGFTHEKIDSGEQDPEKNRSPILVPDGPCPVRNLYAVFSARSAGIDAEIRRLVMTRLHEYEDQQKDRTIP